VDWGRVQAYQKRAVHVIDWLIALAENTPAAMDGPARQGRLLGQRDQLAQQLGLDYPVFTRKAATDVSYLACAHRLLQAPSRIFPQFATHNVRSVATILELAGTARLRVPELHGMAIACTSASPRWRV